MTNEAVPVECCSTNCANVAKYIVYWPGKETKMCAGCTARALMAARAMEFSLSIHQMEEV